jgi:uncharacterized membrane protein YqjE
MNAAAAPLIGRGKMLLDQVLRIAQTRLELLSVEVQREKALIVRQLWLAVAGALCAWLAGFTIILWAALTLEARERTIFLLSLFGLLVLGSLASWLLLRRRAQREPLFTRAIHQLQLDRSSLGPDS